MDRREAARALDVEVDADRRTVERAFRRRAATAHPDRGGDHETFLALRAARERLLSPGPTRPGPGEQAPVRFVRTRVWDRVLRALLDGLPQAWRPRRRGRDLD